eukprot:scaffold6407_cov62-Phaeocystis_antarctica.AAC.1
MHPFEPKGDHGRQRARAQPLCQPLHAIGASCWLGEFQTLERWQHRAQRAQRRQVGRRQACVSRLDHLRLAQLLAAPQPHLAAQRCGHLVINPQLLPHRLRRRPQPGAGAAEVQGDARLKRVAQVAEDAAVLVLAELRERHRSRTHGVSDAGGLPGRR